MALLEPNTASELADTVDILRAELQANPETWENASLESYLEALAAILRDHQGHLISRPESGGIPYIELAHLLRAAAIYE